MHRRAFGFLLGSLALAGCVGAPGQPRSVTTFNPYPGGQGSATPPPPKDRIAILLPLSGPRAQIGQSLLKAAQLALDAPGAPTLDAKDTAGTGEGAASAAREAIAAGDKLILGPLTSAETAAVAPVARAANIGVLAFTNDVSQAQPGVWTLGLTPQQQVRRLVTEAQAQGKLRIAGLLPDNDFGRAMADGLQQATMAAGLQPPTIRSYAKSKGSIDAAAKDLSDYVARGGIEGGSTPPATPTPSPPSPAPSDQAQQAQPPAPPPPPPEIQPPPFDALLLADTGEPLNQIASALHGYEVKQPTVRFMGPALWAVPSSGAATRFRGAWFAGPDPAARSSFNELYQGRYGSPAPAITDLAYDAAAVARVLADHGGYSLQSLTQSAGYNGVDGLFVLQPDGQVRRALAIFAVEPGKPTIVSPPAAALNAPGA